MRPVTFRIEKGVAKLSCATLAMLAANPALAQTGISTTQLVSTTPLAIALGALLCGGAATYMALRQHRQAQLLRVRTQRQLAEMSAALDEKGAILHGMREVTLIWRGENGQADSIGPIQSTIPTCRSIEDILEFKTWLNPKAAIEVSFKLDELQAQGREFEYRAPGLGERDYRISGRVVAGKPLIRISPREAEVDEPYVLAETRNNVPTIETYAALIDKFNHPAWVRNYQGQLVKVNEAYLKLALGGAGLEPGQPIPELFGEETLARHRRLDPLDGGPLSVTEDHDEFGVLDVTMFKLADGTAGYAVQGLASNEDKNDPKASFLTAAINELRTPVAVFDGAGQLTHFNKAFSEFWEMDVAWLETQPSEKALLDRLRTQGKLPMEPDYKKWRAQHLEAYGLKKTRETMWHLPSGQALNVIASPAPHERGVIYIYHNVTEQLALESRYNALIHVQDETLNALSEAVAVFGTDGRLKLHNAQLSRIWKLPMNKLDKQTHIADIASLSADTLPEDGERIWGDLKEEILDFDAERHDKKGRIVRSDNRLIDYAIVRLPDSQTLVTFVDVTEGASFEKVLKERNEALETADKLKDAFVQNISYEFRSPLTNIIGFADLLASEAAGPLTEKQKDYTNFIRASSSSLGLLIDNILDLTTIDAGIAELQTDVLDVHALVEKARKGVLAALQVGSDEVPINLDISIDDNLPTFVADGTRIVQVLYNLLSNAVRYSDPGARVRLDVFERGGRILFVVEDEGVGIPDDIIASVFDRFEGKAVEGRQRGAGLGLSIVKTFVHMHGGTVAIERLQPRGTKVTVNLPAEQVAKGAAE